MSIVISLLMVGSTLILEPKAILNFGETEAINALNSNRIELSAQFLVSGETKGRYVGSLINYKVGGFIGNEGGELGYEKSFTPGLSADIDGSQKYDGIWSVKAKIKD